MMLRGCQRRTGSIKRRLTGAALIVLVSVLSAVAEVPPRVSQAEDTTVRSKTGKILFKALYAPMPVYPFTARLHYEGGQGIFVLMLRRDGTVSAIAVARSTGMKDLDIAAAQALIQWRFPPPPRDMKSIRIPVNFKMRNRVSGRTILD